MELQGLSTGRLAQCFCLQSWVYLFTFWHNCLFLLFKIYTCIYIIYIYMYTKYNDGQQIPMMASMSANFKPSSPAGVFFLPRWAVLHQIWALCDPHQMNGFHLGRGEVPAAKTRERSAKQALVAKLLCQIPRWIFGADSRSRGVGSQQVRRQISVRTCFWQSHVQDLWKSRSRTIWTIHLPSCRLWLDWASFLL